MARTTEDILQDILKELQGMNERLWVLETQTTERQELCRLHEKQLIQYDKRLSGLEQANARREDLPKAVSELSKDLKDLRSDVSALQGSWKTWIAIISATSGFIGGLIGALIRRGGV